MSAIKSGAVSHSRFAKMAEMDYKVSNNNIYRPDSGHDFKENVNFVHSSLKHILL